MRFDEVVHVVVVVPNYSEPDATLARTLDTLADQNTAKTSLVVVSMRGVPATSTRGNNGARALPRRNKTFVGSQLLLSFSLLFRAPSLAYASSTILEILLLSHARRSWRWRPATPRRMRRQRGCSTPMAATSGPPSTPCTPWCGVRSGPRNTRAPHFTPQHWLLCHMKLY